MTKRQREFDAMMATADEVMRVMRFMVFAIPPMMGKGDPETVRRAVFASEPVWSMLGKKAARLRGQEERFRQELARSPGIPRPEFTPNGKRCDNLVAWAVAFVTEMFEVSLPMLRALAAEEAQRN